MCPAPPRQILDHQDYNLVKNYLAEVGFVLTTTRSTPVCTEPKLKTGSSTNARPEKRTTPKLTVVLRVEQRRRHLLLVERAQVGSVLVRLLLDGGGGGRLRLDGRRGTGWRHCGGAAVLLLEHGGHVVAGAAASASLLLQDGCRCRRLLQPSLALIFKLIQFLQEFASHVMLQQSIFSRHC